MNEIGLGRKLSVADSRDKNFTLAKVATVVTTKLWGSPGVLDQGNTSQCVAYSGFKYLTSAPVKNTPKEKPSDIYRQCLVVDEYPGEDWNGGTSVRALFKVLKKLGYVSEYRWALDTSVIINHLLTRGPVVMGTIWTLDMFTPHNATGYIEPTGENQGGHAWLLIGADTEKKNPDGSLGAVRMINSWGAGWGQHGRAWVSKKSLAYLISNDGEACVSTEIKR